MYTSYFANKDVNNPVSISQGPPGWYRGPQFQKLAPPWSLIKEAHSGLLSYAEYKDRYYELVLDHLDPKETYDELVEKFGVGCTLLCFESLKKPDEYCHRRIVADWFETHLGVKVNELEKLPVYRKVKSRLRMA